MLFVGDAWHGINEITANHEKPSKGVMRQEKRCEKEDLGRGRMALTALMASLVNRISSSHSDLEKDLCGCGCGGEGREWACQTCLWER